MNNTPPAAVTDRVRPATKPRPATSPFEPEARAFNALLKAILPELLAVEDETSDLPLRQLKVCVALFEGPRSMSEISRRMGVSQSAMTQTADRLERAGLVERFFQGPDRRVRWLKLTAAGQSMIREHEEAHITRMAAVLSRLSPEDIKLTLDALETVLAACRSQQAE